MNDPMKSWIEHLRSGFAREMPEDRIAGGACSTGIGENLRRHMPFFRRHWKRGAAGACLILLSSILAFPMPLVSRFVIDDVILGRQLSLLPWMLLVTVALAVFSRGLGLFQNWFFLRYSQEMTLDIQKQVLDHSFSLPKSFFDKNQTGYLMARMTGDIGGVTWFLSGSLVGIVTNILYFIGGILLLFWLEWRLALAALGAVPVLLLALRRFSNRMHALNHAGNEENARYMSRLPGDAQLDPAGQGLRCGREGRRGDHERPAEGLPGVGGELRGEFRDGAGPLLDAESRQLRGLCPWRILGHHRPLDPGVPLRLPGLPGLRLRTGAIPHLDGPADAEHPGIPGASHGPSGCCAGSKRGEGCKGRSPRRRCGVQKRLLRVRPEKPRSQRRLLPRQPGRTYRRRGSQRRWARRRS